MRSPVFLPVGSLLPVALVAGVQPFGGALEDANTAPGLPGWFRPTPPLSPIPWAKREAHYLEGLAIALGNVRKRLAQAGL